MLNQKLDVKSILQIIIGSALFAGALNLFIIPLNLFVGGIIGTAQLLDTVFFSKITLISMTAVINFLLNIPIFTLGFASLKKRTLLGTFISILTQTLVLSIIHVPITPILDDKFANIAIGSIIAGIGCGIVLSARSSCGGLDLLGLYLSYKKPQMSVGKINLYYNIVLFTVGAYVFNIQTALYSVLYIAIFSITVDRYHYTNIPVTLMIFTQSKIVQDHIMSKYVRGVTCWKGMGAYTKKDMEVLCTVVSRSEVASVKKEIMEIDSQAFIIEHRGSFVTGGYQKRLD